MAGTTIKAKSDKVLDWMEWATNPADLVEKKENRMWKWCKHCFGMKTVDQLQAEELKHCKQDRYLLKKEIDWAVHRLQYTESRIRLIEKPIESEF